MMLLALALALLPRVFCLPRIESNNWNSSSLISTVPAPATRSPTFAAPYPISGATTAHRPNPTDPAPSRNHTSAQCIINIPSASVDYWLLQVLEYATTSLLVYSSIAPNTTSLMLSASPVTTPIDATSLLSLYGFTDPLAASTSIVTVTNTKPIPPPGIIATSDVDNYVIETPTLATATIGPSTVTSATSFVYFSAYEVETQIAATAEDGKISFRASTATYTLPSPYVYPYDDGRTLDGELTASGDVPKDFYLSIPQSSCIPGTWQAPVTVLIVVELVYDVEHIGRPMIVHIESSVTGLDGYGPSPASTVLPKVHVESSVTDTDLRNTGEPTPEPSGNPHRVHGESSVNGLTTADARTPDTPQTKPNVPAAPTGAADTPHSVPVGISLAPNTIGLATDLPGLFSQLRSFMTAFAHVEQSTPASDAFGQGQPTGPGEPAGQGKPTGPAGGGTAQAAQVTDGLSSDVGVVGTETIKLGPSSVYVVGSFTLTPGAPPITIDGTPISLAPSATAIVVGGFTSSLPQINNHKPPPILTIGSATITGNAASQFFIAPGQTLTPGGTVTVSGTVISLGSSAEYLVVAGTTQVLPTQTLAGPLALITPPPLTIGNGVFTPVPGSGTSYLIGGSLLTPGGVITVANTIISLAPGASFLVVNGATTTLVTPPITTNPPLLTIGTKTFTAQAGVGTTFIIGDQTLTPGGIVTYSGTIISLSPSATNLVIINSGSGTHTETLFPATKITASTAKETGTSGASAALSAGATLTGPAASSHGAAHSIHASSSSLSLFTFALGYLLSLI